MIHKMIYLFVVVSFLIECSPSTPYQSRRFTGGYEETQLDSSKFIISFRGNGYTSYERVSDFCLLRCAEVSKDHGFAYFLMADEKHLPKTYVDNNPSYTSTSGYSVANSVYLNSTNNSSSTVINKHKMVRRINCSKNKTSDEYLNADFVINSIRRKYKMK